MSKRCPLVLSEYHHGALIKVLSNKSRSQRAINSTFLTKAEIVLKETGIKTTDLDFSLDENQGEIYNQSISISPSAHNLLYSLYVNSSSVSKSNLMANVLCRCAEYIENNEEEFEVLLSRAFLTEQNRVGTDIIIPTQDTSPREDEEEMEEFKALDKQSDMENELLMATIDDNEIL